MPGADHDRTAGFRFYKKVGIRESRAVNGMIQYEIVLDGHSLKTPGTERPYRIPSKGLAIAIALEWDQQVRGDIC